MKKKILLILATITMGLAMTACSTKTQDTDTKNTQVSQNDTTDLGLGTDGKLVAITNAEFPPYEYHEGNKIVGIDVDITNAIAQKLGLNAEIVDAAFDSIILAVSSKQADIGIAGLTVTPDRLKNVDFTDSYNTSTQKVLVKNDSELKSVDDLKGKKIGVQLGTTSDIMAEDIQDSKVERFNKSFEAIQAMIQGQIDAVILDAEPAKEFVKSVDGIKMLDEDFVKEDYAIAVKKGNENLKNAINKALKELKEDGTLDAIKAKYIKAE